MEADGDRVLRRLASEQRREGRMQETTREQSAGSRPRSLRFVVAAALILTVAIGVYAFRAQRVLPPQVVLPPAQSPTASVKAPTETTQVAAVTPEPRKSGAAPSREEALAGAAAQIAAAQATDGGATRLKFGAASVRRRVEFEDGPGILNCGGVDGQVFPTQASPAPQGRCAADKHTLDSIIAMAFQASRLNPWSGPEQIVVGIPDTMRKGRRFQIQGVADNPSSATKAELLQMFQNLLMDRFKLRVHREIRQVDGYVLTVAKSGIKLKETPDAEFFSIGPQMMVGNVSMQTLARHLEIGVLPSITGQRFMRPAEDGGPTPLHVPVDDKTGLNGVYAIRANVTRTTMFAGAGGRGESGTRVEYDPPLPRVFEEQLGLVLTRGKVPVEYIVVDHMEEPSEN
jgi:uncharacterized protein (TIGR03435 family)